MSFIANLIKKGNDLKVLTESMISIATAITKLAVDVEKLSKVVQEHEILLAEIYAMQIHMFRSMEPEVPEVKFVDKVERKTEKPN